MDRKSFIQFLIASAFVLVGWYALTQYYPVDTQQKPFNQPAADKAPTSSDSDQKQTASEDQESASQETDQPKETETDQTETKTTADERPVSEGESQDQDKSGTNSKAAQSNSSDEELPEEDSDAEVEEEITLENDFIETSWTNEGAALQELKLKQYKAGYSKEDAEERPLLTLIRDFESGYYSDVIEKVKTRSDPDGEWNNSVNTAGVVYDIAERTDNKIVFRGNLTRDLALEKTVRIEPEDYHYSVQLQFINRTDASLNFTYNLRSAAGIERESLQSRYLSTAVGVQNNDRFDVQLVGASSLKEGPETNESTGIAWGGVVSQYFVSMTWPDSSEWIRAVEQRLVTNTDIQEATGRWDTDELKKMSASEREESARSNGTAILISTEQTLPASDSIEKSYQFVAAPKLKKILESYGKNLANDLRSGSMPWITWVISFGTLSFLTPVMVSILEFFHGIIPNYGIAIILLTILVRLILHPLTKSSQVSMHKMRLLQPKIKELEKKFGDEREKLVQEQMKLYSKYGVHPMSGCWPMFLQMPVFVSLFTALRTSVQLRQATFIPGWITDLSQADTVWHFPFQLPILGNELNILPFIMVVAWMLNQHLTPKPADSKAQQQQKIMKWMPVLFAVMFYQFASGLLLYITASSTFAALQNLYIRNQVADLELKPKKDEADVNHKKKKKKPSKGRGEPEKKGFLGKMMDKLEEQQKNSQQLRKDD